MTPEKYFIFCLILSTLSIIISVITFFIVRPIKKLKEPVVVEEEGCNCPLCTMIGLSKYIIDVSKSNSSSVSEKTDKTNNDKSLAAPNVHYTPGTSKAFPHKL
jgi:hypothetical protein